MPQNVFQVRDLRLKNKQLEYGKQIKAGNNNDEMIQDLALIHEYRVEMQVAMKQQIWERESRIKQRKLHPNNNTHTLLLIIECLAFFRRNF